MLRDLDERELARDFNQSCQLAQNQGSAGGGELFAKSRMISCSPAHGLIWVLDGQRLFASRVTPEIKRKCP